MASRYLLSRKLAAPLTLLGLAADTNCSLILNEERDQCTKDSDCTNSLGWSNYLCKDGAGRRNRNAAGAAGTTGGTGGGSGGATDGGAPSGGVGGEAPQPCDDCDKPIDVRLLTRTITTKMAAASATLRTD